MGMYINSATGSLGLTRSLYQTSVMQSTTMKRLSSGIRINSASDDAAGLSLSEKLKSSINGNTVAKNNAQTGIALLNTADSALSNMTNSLERIRNLAVQAANGVYTSEERQMLQKEVGQLSADIGQTYQSARFSDKNVFGAQQGVTVGTTQTQSITEAQAVAAGYNDAHIIRTAAEFKSKITADLAGSFVMTADIDLSQLGTQTLSVINGAFSGTLDGNGHSANNLSINTGVAGVSGIGVFKEITGSVKNLLVNNASVTGINMNQVGVLVGNLNAGGVIDNCNITGSINSTQGVLGGIAGRVNGGTLKNSSANTSITTTADYSGGITGQALANGTVTNCYSSGTINGGGFVGGLAGGVLTGSKILNSSTSVEITGKGLAGGAVGGCFLGTITGCSASGNVAITTNWGVGGFVGATNQGNISNCYSTGNALGTTAGVKQIGGFVGDCNTTAQISNCYSTGSASGADRVGGFSGSNTSTINNCYATGNVTSAGSKGGFNGFGSSTASNFYKNNMSTEIGSAINGNTSTQPTSSWSATVWDTSGGVPALKSVQRAYGTSTTLVGLQIGDTSASMSKININTAFGLGDTNFTVSGQDSARKTITQVDQMMTFLNTMRSEVGASVNKLSSVISIQDNRINNLGESRSNIQDADVASESAQMIKNQIRQQSGVALLSQMNGLDKNLLMQLIG